MISKISLEAPNDLKFTCSRLRGVLKLVCRMKFGFDEISWKFKFQNSAGCSRTTQNCFKRFAIDLTGRKQGTS